MTKDYIQEIRKGRIASATSPSPQGVVPADDDDITLADADWNATVCF